MLLLTRSCHCQHMLRPFVGLVSTTCANSAQCSDHWHMKQPEHSSFISSHLDYCNSLLYGLPHSLIRKVQCVRNAAAWLLTGTRRGDHILPVLRHLHRLPVQKTCRHQTRVSFFSSLSGPAPPYLADNIHWVLEGPRCQLHSSTNRSCTVPHTQQIWRQKLCCCWATCLEQSPSTLARWRHMVLMLLLGCKVTSCLIALYKYPN